MSFAPLSEAFACDPYAAYARLRDEGAPVWDEALQLWLLPRFVWLYVLVWTCCMLITGLRSATRCEISIGSRVGESFTGVIAKLTVAVAVLASNTPFVVPLSRKV